MPILPAKWRQIGLAVASFREYMLDQLADEKRLIAEGKPGSGTLMSNLVRASEARHGVAGVNGDKKTVANDRPHEMRPLSVDEILGDIFVFNFAGHDTTAISLAFSMLLLVAHPDIQDWLSEELSFYLETTEGGKWGYEASFPKLKRCRAVLLETLRLYNPLPGVPKYTGIQPRIIRSGNQEMTLLEDTLVVANLNALQTHPKYWGEDSLIWRPSRWILDSSDDKRIGMKTRLARESLLTPRNGTFIAWSEGARSCPGKKFAQVEFVATMAAVFRNFRAEPIPKIGETPDAARNRVLDVVKDSNVELLLQMRNPDSISVRWSRRC
ncbi:MAG: hypothetical protein Q9195_004749 [Heterodermia aff. obscurata]